MCFMIINIIDSIHLVAWTEVFFFFFIKICKFKPWIIWSNFFIVKYFIYIDINYNWHSFIPHSNWYIQIVPSGLQKYEGQVHTITFFSCRAESRYYLCSISIADAVWCLWRPDIVFTVRCVSFLPPSSMSEPTIQKVDKKKLKVI